MIELLTFSKCYLTSFKEKKTDNIAMNVLPCYLIPCYMAPLVAQRVKKLPAMQETWLWCLGQKDPLEKQVATHSSILAWRIPRTEEPGELQSMGSQRVRHNWVTKHAHTHTHTHTHTEAIWGKHSVGFGILVIWIQFCQLHDRNM